MSALFVYGSLMHPEVLSSIITPNCRQSAPMSFPAVLPGYKRHPVRQVYYPACIAGAPEDCIHGVLVCGLDDASLARLDKFEGTEFVREKVVAIMGNQVADTSALAIEAYAYIWRESVEQLDVDSDWDYEQFLRHDFELFMLAERGYL